MNVFINWREAIMFITILINDSKEQRCESLIVAVKTPRYPGFEN